MRKKKSLKYIPALICLFVLVGQFTVNLYLPSLPDIAQVFHVSIHQAEASLSLYLVSFGLSQLFYGPASDYYGRRKVLILGVFIVLIGNVLASMSNSMWTLNASRFIQGLGAGSVMVLARTILRDCFSGDNLARMLSTLAMILAATPAIAPFIGGHIHSLFGWRMNFILLSVYAGITWIILLLVFPETNRHPLPYPIRLRVIMKNFYLTLQHKIYLSYTLLIMLVFAFQVVYLTATPFIYQERLGTTASFYGTLMVIPAIGYFIGNYYSKKLTYHYPPFKIIAIGIFILLLSSASLLAFERLHFIHLSSLTGVLFFVMLGSGFIYANCLAGTLKPFSSLAGTAAALSGALQMVSAALFSRSIEYFHISNATRMGVYFIILSILLALAYSTLIYGPELKAGRRHEPST